MAEEETSYYFQLIERFQEASCEEGKERNLQFDRLKLKEHILKSQEDHEKALAEYNELLCSGVDPVRKYVIELEDKLHKFEKLNQAAKRARELTVRGHMLRRLIDSKPDDTVELLARANRRLQEALGHLFYTLNECGVENCQQVTEEEIQEIISLY